MAEIANQELPEKLNYPFFYQPHPLSVLASKKVQEYLDQQFDRAHNFGLKNSDKGIAIGKMFGVLVVRNTHQDIGFLCAFSGKLADSNVHDWFVPPVFDMLVEGDFFKTQGHEIIQINKQLEKLENDDLYLKLKTETKRLELKSHQKILKSKTGLKVSKKIRDNRRAAAKNSFSEGEFKSLLEQLGNESIGEQLKHKQLVRDLNRKLDENKVLLAHYELEIQSYKNLRKSLSKTLQNQLFDSYHFINGKGERKSLLSIFNAFGLDKPPAGAGECAAPKLLNYAYQHQLEPIALGEFWWGASPKSEVRKHGQFYPACRSKCEPILGFMLEGISVEENPMLQNPGEGKPLPIIYEDESIIVVNKPAEFLSVPGKNIDDSVYSRIKALRPEATGPIIIHRLDMSTSGIMVLAKNKHAHDYIQRQFIKRQVDKTYIAMIEGSPPELSGVISLPLRVDLDNRPQQLVCNEHGKKAITEWRVLKTEGKSTFIEFKPITGRTHQLRVHAAHPDGLNSPIVGDDLYGTKGNRLLLHAASLTIKHPKQKEMITFTTNAEFFQQGK